MTSWAVRAYLLVDIKRTPEVNRIAFDPVERLTVGAAVACAGVAAEQHTKDFFSIAARKRS
jgi:CO/xanthine dehydrogenase FAD-binding subunit